MTGKRLLLLLLPILAACLLPLQAAAADAPIEPGKAFRLSARALDASNIEVRFDIADGYYLYRDKFSFASEPAEVKLGSVALPPGEIRNDEFFGAVQTYRKDVRFAVPVELPAQLAQLKLIVTSQGCWDQGVCYPPLAQTATVALADVPASAGGARADLFGAKPAASSSSSAGLSIDAANGDETSRIAQMMKDAGFWLIVASFFGFGALLAFTPCVFPMIPILSGIIVGHGSHLTRSRALGLSGAYVLGMATTYAIAGVAAGLSGTLLAAALQTPWVLGAFAGLFVLLALSMFGFYELQLPAALQTRLSESANQRRTGSVVGVAAMGALSAIIAGPCVAAPLAGALLYIAQTGDAVLGGAALFFMALGMGAPLVAVAVSAHRLLPRAGAWMEAVKKFFGVTMLGVAIWLVTPVVPGLVAMLAWAALLIFSAMFLHALDPLPPHAPGWQRFWKGAGVVALLVGASLLIGALAGSRDPLQPLAILRAGSAAAQEPVRFERLRSAAELDQRLREATRPVLLDFYADWCVACKEMERFTFADSQVQAKLAGMLLLQADVTANSAQDQALLKRFGLFGPPGIIFFDARGNEIQGLRVVGYMPAERFLVYLDRVLALASAAPSDAG